MTGHPPTGSQGRWTRPFGGWTFYVYASAAIVIGVLTLVPLHNDALRSAPPAAQSYDKALLLVAVQQAEDALPLRRDLEAPFPEQLGELGGRLHAADSSPADTSWSSTTIVNDGVGAT